MFVVCASVWTRLQHARLPFGAFGGLFTFSLGLSPYRALPFAEGLRGVCFSRHTVNIITVALPTRIYLSTTFQFTVDV